eukprot:Nitzschia sp. Nitz4//scaffold45_size130396//15426//16217//NITZ4_003430-RA/size130396-processed-gene-0.174-mRNA-1//1//CDS//3329552341//7294//frame0
MVIDLQGAAALLQQVKSIATKEFESLQVSSKHHLFDEDEEENWETTSAGSEEEWVQRKRTVSIDSAGPSSPFSVSSPILSSVSFIDPRVTDSPQAKPLIRHHDWSKRATLDALSPPALITQKYGKRKREVYVGLTTDNGVVRATLRKKFSWKQYPELEEYLMNNQEEYFQFSSKNYTAEQRKYNNRLTRGLLDLAAAEGYVFEEFTFPMVRDRIRCYYKSHSQSAKKKRRR